MTDDQFVELRLAGARSDRTRAAKMRHRRSFSWTSVADGTPRRDGTAESCGELVHRSAEDGPGPLRIA
jgi:hypothetical protein